MKQKQKQRVVIVGAGFAGIEIAKRLAYSETLEVTLISKSDTFEYYPALYRLVTGALPIEVSVPITKIFSSKKVSFVQGTYTGFDQARQVVTLESGKEFPYDYLVLALGSETNYFNIPGLPDRSYSFKSVKEALRLKQHFYDLMTRSMTLGKDEAVILLHTIIVGGGPSGVELAGDLKHYLTRLAKEYAVDPSYVTIDLIESNNRILPTFPPAVSVVAEARLRKMGINIFANRTLQSQEIQEIALSDMDMKAGTVVWTAGTRINTGYTGLPLTERKRIAVTDTLTLPNDNRVFIAGDGAGTMYSGLAQTAIHNGAYIASAIASIAKGKTPATYKPKKPSFVVPIGENWAVLSHNNFLMKGFIPWVLRNMIDFKYFLSIVSLPYVFAVFQQGKKYRKVHGGCSMSQ
jgi:NADH:ubiquinone reductase (H+-translocating)